MKDTLTAHDLELSSIGSPIGKIYIDDEFSPHLERMRHAAEVAHFFAAPYVRIFSFFLRPGADPCGGRAARGGTVGGTLPERFARHAVTGVFGTPGHDDEEARQ
jgi:hypothetical protein